MAGPMIEYQKIMTEIVYVNLPAPKEPTQGMTGTDLLQGFLGELERVENPEFKKFLNAACMKWNIRYRWSK